MKSSGPLPFSPAADPVGNLQVYTGGADVVALPRPQEARARGRGFPRTRPGRAAPRAPRLAAAFCPARRRTSCFLMPALCSPQRLCPGAPTCLPDARRPRWLFNPRAPVRLVRPRSFPEPAPSPCRSALPRCSRQPSSAFRRGYVSEVGLFRARLGSRVWQRIGLQPGNA